ncbi:MAG: hypothetical protein WC304_02180 [Candidatus Gracilibacteria bacterium]
MPTTIKATEKENQQLRQDLKKYEELLAAQRAINAMREESKNGKLKTLTTLTKLMGCCVFFTAATSRAQGRSLILDGKHWWPREKKYSEKICLILVCALTAFVVN